MRKTIGILFLTAISFVSFAQTKIHSHNDYNRQRPFFEAYELKADQIEVDIFLVGDSLVVAHSKKQIKIENTLNKLYLMPIASLFKQHKNRCSVDDNYTFSLMIDVKENWDLVYPVLKREIEMYGNVFNRNKSKAAIQIVISGARPADSTFHTYPNWLFFDGLPSLTYAKKDLKRITMISDNFSKYSKWKGVGLIPEVDKRKLLSAVQNANQLNRPFRFWGAPDTKDCWLQLNELGKVIINTDKIKESKLVLTAKNEFQR